MSGKDSYDKLGMQYLLGNKKKEIYYQFSRCIVSVKATQKLNISRVRYQIQLNQAQKQELKD